MNEWKKDLAKVAEIERHALATKNESLLEKARMTRARIERRLALDGRTDLELAELFLFGRFTQTKGKVRLKYLEGSEEDEPRRALVRILRGDSPPDRDKILWRLASLFDDNSSSDRKLIFERRREGRPGLNLQDRLTIARCVGELRQEGKSEEEACGEAGERFGVSAETARNHWRECRGVPFVPQPVKLRNKPRNRA